MDRIRWTVIGAGGIADRRAIPALLCDAQNEIVAVMDRLPAVAQAVAEKYGIAGYYDDAEAMLNAVPCDAVYIATPVSCHYEQSMLALRHGAHVFIEKPLAMNAREGREIVDAFRAAGKQLTVGYMMGYHNLHCKARELLQNGELGTLNLVRMQFSCWYPDIPGAWRQTRALSGGGCVMDLAVHCMELFTSITGEDIADCRAYTATRTFRYEVEDSAVILFRSEGGTLGHIDVNFNIPDNCATSKLELYGTEGSIYAEGTLGQEETGNLKFIRSPQGAYEAAQSRLTGEPVLYTGDGGNIYLKQFKTFQALLSNGALDYTNAERSVKIQQLCDGIYANSL